MRVAPGLFMCVPLPLEICHSQPDALKSAHSPLIPPVSAVSDGYNLVGLPLLEKIRPSCKLPDDPLDWLRYLVRLQDDPPPFRLVRDFPGPGSWKYTSGLLN